MKNKRVLGSSYVARVKEINEIYDTHLRSGLPNREILRRYIWPKYKISERTLYNYLNVALEIQQEEENKKAESRKKQDRE